MFANKTTKGFSPANVEAWGSLRGSKLRKGYRSWSRTLVPLETSKV